MDVTMSLEEYERQRGGTRGLMLTEDERVAYRAGYAAGLKEAAQVVDQYLAHYPPDIFLPPIPGQHGQTVDACSAAALREVLPHVADDIRAMLLPTSR